MSDGEQAIIISEFTLVLDELNIAYAIGGSIASSSHGSEVQG